VLQVSSIDADRAKRIAFILVLALLTLAFGYAYSPLLNAWFIADDWHFFALFRHLNSPLVFLTDNPLASYFYRPIPLLAGWSLFQVFGLSPAANYAFNIALHVWVAIEVYRLATVNRGRGENAFFALSIAFVFALLPMCAATVAWISNRFDLMATGAALAAMRHALSPSSSNSLRRYVPMFVWLAVACLSKETGFAAVPACACAIALRASSLRAALRDRQTISVFAGLVVFVAAIFSLRLYAMGRMLPPDGEVPQRLGYFEGTLRWFEVFAKSLAFDRTSAIAMGAALFVSLAIALVAFIGQRDHKLNGVRRHRELGIVVATLGTYALFVLLAQAPILKAAFPDNLLATVSFRLFYSIIAATFSLLACLVCLGGQHWSSNGKASVGILAFTMALLVLAPVTHAFNAKWSHDMNFRREATVSLVQKLRDIAVASTARGERCVMRLDDATDELLNNDGVLDLALKSHLHSDDPATNCLVIGKKPITTSFTRIEPCETSSFAPFRSVDVRTATIPLSGTCKFFFLRE
jgi:hypothetical protein